MSRSRVAGQTCVDDSGEHCARIALAEDDDELRCTLADSLSEDGFEVSILPDGKAILDHLEEARRADRYPDVLVLDHRMPGMAGLEVLGALRRAGSHLRTIVITGFGAEVRHRARGLDAYTVLDKPFDLDEFLRAVRSCAGRRGGRRAQGPINPGAPACAACNSSEHLRLRDTAAGVYFCADCWSRSEPPGPFEDVGGSG